MRTLFSFFFLYPPLNWLNFSSRYNDIHKKKPQNSQLTVSNDFLNIQRQKSYFAGAGAGASAAAVMHTIDLSLQGKCI